MILKFKRKLQNLHIPLVTQLKPDEFQLIYKSRIQFSIKYEDNLMFITYLANFKSVSEPLLDYCAV